MFAEIHDKLQTILFFSFKVHQRQEDGGKNY